MNVGSHIGQYRILRKLGAGGMGTVYLGEHILLGRKAAIKTLLPSLSMQADIVERFFTEARATSAISDHGVVQIFDFGYHVDGTAYIVMELLEGESLQTRIDRLGKLAPSEALRIGRQVSGSLAAAHACDIVHRDLKPENIYLIADGEAQGGERTKILDFGICKLGTESGDASLTQSGTTMGTPVYMSPEQCRGAGGVDCRSDIYALGCVLFHMVAGRPPFECEGAGDFIVAHLQEVPPPPSAFVDDLPDLGDGAHSFAVRARDRAGNVDSAPAIHAWVVDTSTPDTQLLSGPSGASGSTAAQFTFVSPDAGGGATFQCRLDGGNMADSIRLGGGSFGGTIDEVWISQSAITGDEASLARYCPL